MFGRPSKLDSLGIDEHQDHVAKGGWFQAKVRSIYQKQRLVWDTGTIEKYQGFETGKRGG